MSAWQKLSLPECLEKSPRSRKIPKKEFLVSGMYPVVSQEKSLVSGYWNNEDDVVRLESPVVIFGDHTQVLKLIDFDFVVGADGVRILKPKEFLDARYLYYFLLSHPIRELGYARHFRLLKQLDVHFPSLPEQKHIVAVLDEAFVGIDAAIANTEKNLANARALFESYLNSIFRSPSEHWMESPLSDLCSIKHGYAFKSRYFAKNGQHIVLTPGSFWEHGGFKDQGERTKYYDGEIPEGYVLEKGDFLIAMTEQAVGLLGSSLIVPEARRYLHNQRLGLVEVHDGSPWDNDFFFHQFNTSAFRQSVQSTASGVKVRHTSPNKLGAINVKYPENREEQAAIGTKLNGFLGETKELESLYRNKVAALVELKRSLLQKAFSGKLTADVAEKEVDEAVA